MLEVQGIEGAIVKLKRVTAMGLATLREAEVAIKIVATTTQRW